MKNFEYAQPHTEAEVLALLSPQPGRTEILAGGTDLVGLMKKMIVTPDRVVNIGEIESLRQIEPHDEGGLRIGAAVRLDDFLDSRLTDRYPAVKQAIQGINSIQLQAQGTIGGELLRRPMCWYFRAGHGLLGENGKAVVDGDNRYHAILGNHGPAKFVNASRLAPALISLGAQVRVLGPGKSDESLLPLAELYRVPQSESERENVLLPGQFITHLILPPDAGQLSAAYEVRASEGPGQPLAAAAATFAVIGGIVQQACIVMGQVAPVPWRSRAAETALLGRPINEETAAHAGQAAVADASPLKDNGYKVQLAQVAVKRAILRAAGLDMGGF
jgi:xanthine dehydrogenase YagS FAD-binding subunit